MAFQTVWYQSQFPEEVVELIEKEVLEDSTVPENNWVGGLIWHYLLRANRENFMYDIRHLDNSSVKYKVYNEGEGQTWHVDAKPLENDEEESRKISFTVQLSEYDEYEGGNVQFMDEGGRRYLMPRNRGCISLYDSNTLHRVQPVTKGTRKSLVGWCVGPQWN